MNTNLTWVGIAVGSLIVVGAIALARLNRHSASEKEIETGKNLPKEGLKSEHAYKENIRQIALIEKDEFVKFYEPVIARIQQYEHTIGEDSIPERYFETVYKALRKRRSAIFDYGSSEKDQSNKAIWTFALFSAISIRYLVTRLSLNQYQTQQGIVNPMLVARRKLVAGSTKNTPSEYAYAQEITNIHLIDKILGFSVIDQLAKAGIYPFVVNAVSGFYHERINPFYSIIEQVESFVSGAVLNQDEIFKGNLKRVLTMLENNVFTKNQLTSLVFEGQYYLLVDRNFLWELFRIYAVSSAKPLSKIEFEMTLKKLLSLGDSIDKNHRYSIELKNNLMDDSQEKVIVELTNMLALAYRVIPYYQCSNRHRISKKAIHRNIAVSDTDQGIVEDQSTKVVPENARIIGRESAIQSQDEHVGLGDLFSEKGS